MPKIAMIQTKLMTWLLIRIIPIIRSARKYPAPIMSKGIQNNRGIVITSLGNGFVGVLGCARVKAAGRRLLIRFEDYRECRAFSG